MADRLAWFYRVQQRLALTPGEARAVLTLASFLLAGLVLQHILVQPVPLPNEGLPNEGLPSESLPPPTAALPADTIAVPADTVQLEAGRLDMARINLNTATPEVLQQLPRIGPKLAARVVAYRVAHGPFRRVQDLVQVRGIGEKTLAQLAPYLYVETP